MFVNNEGLFANRNKNVRPVFVHAHPTRSALNRVVASEPFLLIVRTPDGPVRELFVHLFFHRIAVFIELNVFVNWTYEHQPLHSSMETIGAAVAVGTALLLLMLEKRQGGTNFNITIAAALLVMGLFDALHAVVQPGTTFVWLHSLSTAAGGLLFAMVWLVSVFRFQISFAWGCFVVAVLTGAGSLLFPVSLPEMTAGGGFTTTAHVLNMGGGLLFLLASLRLGLSYRKTGHGDDALFAVHCFLFGLAALTFGLSELWDFTWWGWHILRLLAYGAALIFAFDSLLEDQEMLQARRDELEQMVEKRTEDLQQALQEKRTLLQEVHHRVKNNMQVIASMLNLQASNRDDERLVDDHNDSLQRIRSMALVHELLYQSDSVAELNFTDYVRRLTDNLFCGLDGEPDIQITADDVQLDTDTAVRCGLILNELLTNCLKHAFEQPGEGTIEIAFQSEGQTYRMIVRDNGRGMDEQSADGLSTQSDSIGLGLVKTLAETDLQGEFDIDGSNGTTVTVEFPK